MFDKSRMGHVVGLALFGLGATLPVGPVVAQTPPPATVGAPLPAVPDLPTLTPAQKKQQEVLLAALKDDAFPWELVKDKTTGPLLVDLAGGARPGPVVVAALRGMTSLYAAMADDGHLAVTPEYRRVVLARLTVPRPEVQVRAFSAVTPLLQGKVADEAAIAHLKGLLRPETDVAVRLAIAESLGQVSLYALRDTPTLPDLALAALADAEPAVRLMTLANLMTFVRSQSFVERAGPRLPAAVLAAVTDGPVAVRVVAASTLAMLRPITADEGTKGKALEVLLALLKSPEPALRAAGAMALVHSPHPPALPRLMALLDDKGSSMLRFRGPKTLDGSELDLPVSAVSLAPLTVCHAAVQAVMMASNPAMGKGFYCEAPSSGQEEADLKACIAKARAWYGKGRSGK